MAILTRENVIKAERFNIVEVDVTEWGPVNPETGEPEKTTVFVRELSIKEKERYDASLWEMKRGTQRINLENHRARLAVLTCCDASRNPVFQPEDVEWLSKKSVRPLNRIVEAAKKINDILPVNDEEEEEQVKN